MKNLRPSVATVLAISCALERPLSRHQEARALCPRPLLDAAAALLVVAIR